ncbi:hypothetical protein KIPB_005228 [Kipferlia bialata]|uniref:Rubredoxin-like domain-containing protein n=1 Tax=Kipferlia bialata TaxID=797122 RepID=A0A391P2G1_9EUKA|nr:hypothetical protein KIPB_005228 [Kipferlia bialata]|eukprot:g5228.t1
MYHPLTTRLCVRARTSPLAVRKGEDIPAGEWYICPVCGHLEFLAAGEGEIPERCVVCKAKRASFVKVE